MRWLCAGIKRFKLLVVCDKNMALSTRIFGYSRALARTNSHFGGVELGTQFAISDLRSLCHKRNNQSKSLDLCPGAEETRTIFGIAGTRG